MKVGKITLSGILMLGLVNAFGGNMEAHLRTGLMKEGALDGWFVVNDGVMRIRGIIVVLIFLSSWFIQ